jgi:hypothetical protein
MIGESWAGPSGSVARLVEKRAPIGEPERADDAHVDAEKNAGGSGEMMWDIAWSGWVKELPEPSLMHHM